MDPSPESRCKSAAITRRFSSVSYSHKAVRLSRPISLVSDRHPFDVIPPPCVGNEPRPQIQSGDDATGSGQVNRYAPRHGRSVEHLIAGLEMQRLKRNRASFSPTSSA